MWLRMSHCQTITPRVVMSMSSLVKKAVSVELSRDIMKDTSLWKIVPVEFGKWNLNRLVSVQTNTFTMTIKVTHIVYDITDYEELYKNIDLPTELVFDIDSDSDDVEDDIVYAINNITGWRVKSYKWTEVVD